MTQADLTSGRPAVEFDNVSIIFGDKPQRALPLADQGLNRGAIREATGIAPGLHEGTFAGLDVQGDQACGEKVVAGTEPAIHVDGGAVRRNVDDAALGIGR